ncbi:uncharacterized protein BDV14DRAFT_197009 [Aspergillus stella-maris]|uniref:uncharacterized protein n=1 Tax=Aspergillus stella-maris TaxID=1810926 RepID=UPI003CCE3490
MFGTTSFNFHRFTIEPHVPSIGATETPGLAIDTSNRLTATLGTVTNVKVYPDLVLVEPRSIAAAGRFEVATVDDLDAISATEYGDVEANGTGNELGIWKRSDGAILIGEGKVLKVARDVVVAFVV